MTETSTPAPDHFARSLVLIDNGHDAAQQGPAGSLTVPQAVALDDSLALPGVSFLRAELQDPTDGLGPLLVTLHCSPEAVRYDAGAVRHDCVTIHGIALLTPEFKADPVRETEQGYEVDLFVQSVMVRSKRPEDPTIGYGGYQNWAYRPAQPVPEDVEDGSPRH